MSYAADLSNYTTVKNSLKVTENIFKSLRMSNVHEISMAVKPVADVLERLGVKYFIGGSVASSAYGIARSTFASQNQSQNFKASCQPALSLSE
jgi:hypothetical protein